MKQGNGSDIFATEDARNADIGIIYVASDDDRKTVLTGILTQNKLKRKQIVIVLPTPNKAFQHSADLSDLRAMRQKIQGQLIFILPEGSPLASFVRHRRFPVFSSLEDFAASFQQSDPPDDQSPLPQPDETERETPRTDHPTRPLPPLSPPTPKLTPADSHPVPPPTHESTANPFFYDDFELWRAGEKSHPPTVDPDKNEPLEDLWGDPEDYARAQSIRQAAQQQPLTPDDDNIFEVADTSSALPEQDEDVLLPPWTKAEPPSKKRSAPLSPWLRAEDKRESLPDLPSRPLVRPALPRPLQTRPLRTNVPPHSHSSAALASSAPVRRPINNRPPRFTPGSGRRQAWFISHPWLLVLSVFVLLVLIGSILIFVPPVLVNSRLIPPPSASVTILPASATLQKTYTIAASTTPLSASQHQVQARFLSYTTSSQTVTTKATGMGLRPAVAAQGSLTLYNALPYVQTIAAGTVFTDTNGVQLVSDRIASIPAAQIPTEGVVTVAAHALVAGSSGNIPALDFNGVPCCTQGITIQNSEAFHDGQDTQHYTFVQQSDIDSVATPLKAQITQSGQTSLQAQILPSEQSVAPIRCLPTVSSDHAPGDKATSVTVTVTETCTNEVYNQQTALAMAANQLKLDAAQHLGPGYTLPGSIKTLLTNVQMTNSAGSLSLLVAAEGTWRYQFSMTQRNNLARTIAGKSDSDAQALLHQRGIASVTIQHAWPGGSILPENPDQVAIIVQ